MTDTTGGRGPDEPPEPEPAQPADPLDPVDPVEPGEVAAEAVAPAKVRPTNEELRGPRPTPSIPSLAGTAAGVFIVFGLFLLLGELGGDARLAGIGISLVFEVLGVALLQFSKGRRSATAGGTIAAIAIIPLLGFLFIDTPGNTIDAPDDVTNPVTAVLVVAALVWFCAWYFGPGRRYAFFLGAACLALWLAAQVQIVSNPIDQVFGGITTASSFTPVGPALGSLDSGSSYDPYDSGDIPATTAYGSVDEGTAYPDTFDPDSYDPSDYETSDFDYDYDYESDVPDVEDPSTKLGVVSLLFGSFYLLAAGRRDRVGDGRAGTALFAVAAPALFYGVAYLGGDLGTVGTSAVALALGGCALWLGTRAGRRFTSWAGTAACVFAVLSLVDEAVGDSGRASAAVLVAIGLVIAVSVAVVEARRDQPPPPADATPPSDDEPPAPDAEAAEEPAGPGVAF